MNHALLEASWLAVRRLPVLGPLAAAGLLVLATVPWQDRYATEVLHGVAVLAACALAGATDDPAAEVTAASPYPRWVRTRGRLGVAAALVAPVVAVAAVVAELRAGSTPLLLLLSEVVGFCVAAVALGAVLRAASVTLPAYPAAVGVLVAMLLVRQLPRGWDLVDVQPWGPPWEGAMVRWLAVVVLASAVLAVAVRDPWEGPALVRPARALRAPGRARSAPS